MNKYRKSISIVILMLIISSTVFSNILADEITPPAISPSFIVITNVIKGSEFNKSIFIDNIDDVDHIVNLSFIGDIESWVSFYNPSNETIPITSILVNKSSYVSILLKFKVPEDTANGIYYGNMSAFYEDSQTNETGVSVKPGQQAPVQIEVTGEQIINMSVERIVVKDAEIGFPVVNEIDCKNNGNVVVKPKIAIEYSLENIFVGNITKSGKDLDPIYREQTKTYTMYWDTSSLVRLGNYTAFFNITLNENIIKQEKITFKIIREGTLTRSGTLGELRFQQQPEKGTDAVLIANFTNTGEIDIYAQFNVSIYLNGLILYKNTSEQYKVPLYNISKFKSNIPIQEDGQYVVKGHVYYYDTQNIINGETEELEVTFNIGATSILDIDRSILVLLIIVMIFALILILFLIMHKKRSSTRNKIKKADKKGKVSKKSTRSETPKGRIRIARNKEKSPFKTYQEDKTQKKMRPPKKNPKKKSWTKKNDNIDSTENETQ